jgi:hypothetical protein
MKLFVELQESAVSEDRAVCQIDDIPGLRTVARALALFGLVVLASEPARALPSFAVQTGQPCAACHVGAFGPQLKPYGRDFKLHGYAATDGQDHGPPLAMQIQTSFTHTNSPQAGGAAPGFRPNDNLAIDDVSIYYAGKIAKDTGGFIELAYNGIAQQPQWGNIDIRHIGEGELFGSELLWGLTANNAPTVSDPWNSTPVWGFPYVRSTLAPLPMAATLVDNGLAQRNAGAGSYLLWNDLVYAEFDLYKGLNPRGLEAVGEGPADSGNQTNSLMPYARLALMKDWEKHHAEVGAYMLYADGVVPGGDQTFGLPIRATDVALDGTYQYIEDPAKVTSNMISAHTTFIHEDSTIIGAEGTALFGTPNHALDTFRADVSYSIAATITPSVQYFRTSGTPDPIYWSTPTGSPNSDGMIFEVAYVPFGKPDSPFPNFNVRLAVQYVSYFSFNGVTTNASSNNNLYISLWTALQF